MTRGKLTRAADIEIRLLREGLVESTHMVQAVACDDRGRLLMLAGDSGISSFARSALKPFQALAVVASGTLDHFGLSNRDLAIMCSSHQGDIAQARQVFNILWHCGIEPSALQCPIPQGKSSALQHNCSGKHAGMLAMCRHGNWSIGDYLQYSHPAQQAVSSVIGELLGIPAQEFVVARDDCGAPTYLMPLQELATLFAKLTSGDNLQLERIVRAMTGYPELISGHGGFDTDLMRLTGGEIVSKAGAEGMQCMGRVGERLGVAIKVTDGAKRAKYAAAIHILKQLGWIGPDVSEALEEKYVQLNAFKRLEAIGELKIA
ncbi:MAG: asparaginase [Limnothrix sp. CACIAM 69d]|jgi:L-asparaginase|uniref:Asparaginase n=1 Tax=Limnothrix redekei LRLZ20PSL1 TaxID=3112953 RepID=A0ABW7C9Y9_9CYAN|nr:MAG: asparaginase [Limnothrix sp. CACIAM 69d]